METAKQVKSLPSLSAYLAHFAVKPLFAVPRFSGKIAKKRVTAEYAEYAEEVE
jgi:hypothetical protein